MAKLDLSIYGITDVKEILHNPSYEELYKAETDPKLEGYEKGYLTELGAVNVMTGIYTGRSPKDKFFVKNEASEDSVWWTSDEYKNDNKPCSEEAWAEEQKKWGAAGMDGGACLGFSHDGDDEPIERCKRCIACTSFDWDEERERLKL